MTALRQGSAALALAALRTAVKDAVSPLGWELLEADNRYSAWNALASPGNGGAAMVFVSMEEPQDQAHRALVSKLTVAVVLAGRKHFLDPAAARIAARASGGGLEDAADRVKGAVLSMSLPPQVLPNPACAVPRYEGRNELVLPDGIPLDGCELRFSMMLAERFSPQCVENE